MKMEIMVLEEAGDCSAMEGLSLSYLQPVENMPKVATRLLPLGEPECKFLRQIHVWVKITGPWYWWKHMQTYNVGVDWPDFQSSSTMHKLLSRELIQADFAHPIPDMTLYSINRHIKNGNLIKAANELPGGYLYTRVLCFNYSALRNIIHQRHKHKLLEWHQFCDQILDQVEYPEFLT